MGTHISRVKSIDLDMWTPEQMESIQRWGNARVNAYWEAHLKPGHIPPEHKIESFIRSKYESRRWALDGPPPTDPSVLDSRVGGSTENSTSPTSANTPIAPPSNPRTPVGGTSSSNANTRQPQPHQLLSTGVAGRQTMTTRQAQATTQAAAPAPAAPAAAPPQPSAREDLFSLDFHSPSPPPAGNGAAAAPRKDVKQDILSLFSTPAANTVPVPTQSAFGQFTAAPPPNQWAQMGSGVPAQPTQPTSMMGSTGWGASSGWAGAGHTVVPPAQANVWAATSPTASHPQAGNQSLFGTDNVWANPTANSGGSNDAFGSFASPAPSGQKKDDVFGDLWGGFK